MNLTNINRTKFAFSASVATHLILFSGFLIFIDKNEMPNKQEQKRLEVVFAQSQKPEISTEFLQEPAKIVPKKIEPQKIEQKEVKQEKIEPKKEQIASQVVKKLEVNETKIKPEPEQKILKKEIAEKLKETKTETKQEVKITEQPQKIEQKQPEIVVQNIPKIIPKPQKQSLESFLGSKIEPAIDEKTQSYIKLYGKEFESFDSETKKYLIDNLSGIGNVTKKYLTYPQISIRTNQQGLSAVEFILMPNGDIKDLKLLQSSFYSALDQSTLRTIQIAYKDYPKPTKPTKIRIYVNYILR